MSIIQLNGNQNQNVILAVRGVRAQELKLDETRSYQSGQSLASG